MPITQQGFVPVSGTITVSYPTTPKLSNITLSLANTEYSFALTTSLKQLIIKSRGLAKLQISFNSGESGTTFFTLPKGTNLSLTDVELTGKVIYVQSDTPSTIVEVLELY